LYGHNWRLGEVEALIAFQQFQKFENHINARRSVGELLKNRLENIPGLIIPSLAIDTTHDYYVLGMRIESNRNRNFIEKALRAEGLSTLITRYSGLESLPAFQQFNDAFLRNASLLNDTSFIGIYLAGHRYSEQSILEIESAFRQVFSDERSFN
jgi:dTDP-4-amino-4,6-dideoxygalactose transaminase